MQLLQFFGSLPNKYQRFSSYYKCYDLYSAKKRAIAFYTYFNSVMLSGMRKFPTRQHKSWCPMWALSSATVILAQGSLTVSELFT